MSENANAAPGWYPGNGEKTTACVIDSKAPAGQETSHPPKNPASAPSATGAATITIPVAKAGNYLATLPVASIKVGNRFRQDQGDILVLNPPYAQPAIAHSAEKLCQEVAVGNVTAALVLTHGHTDTAWFPRLASVCDGVCFTRGRIGFLDPEGKKASPTQGQTLFLFGKDRLGLFYEAFAKVGLVMTARKGLEGEQ